MSKMILHRIVRCFWTGQKNYLPRPYDSEYTKARLDYDPFYQYTIFGETPRSKEGGKYFVTMIRGTGVGPELMDAVHSVFTCANIPVMFDIYDLPGTADERDFQDVVLSIRRNGACIKGFIEPPKGDQEHAINLTRNMRLRNELKLYAYKMHFKSIPGITKVNDMDIILVRQNIEGEYAMLEHEPVPGVVQNLKIVTRHKTERLARYTFEMAKQTDHCSVKCVYLEDVTPDMFIKTVAEVARTYPEIAFDFISVQAAMMKIMYHPEAKEILIVESAHGSVMTMCILGMLGSPGLTAGCNYGDRYAVFEPAVRSKCTKIAGKGIVNPTAALRCGVELLHYLGLCYHAELVEEAVLKTLHNNQIHTPDLGGSATTKDFIMNVIKEIKESTKIISYCNLTKPPQIPPPPTTPTAPFDPKLHPLGSKEKTTDEEKNNCKY